MSKATDSVSDIVLSKSKEIIESYIFSTSRRNLSIYSERLLMRIVEIAQRQVFGLNFRDGEDIGEVSIGPLGDARLEIPIKSLLGEGNTNYTQAKNAIMELMQSPYYVERPKMRGGEPVLDKDGMPEFEFIGHQILNDCEVNVKPGVAIVNVNENTWRAVLDFSRGFRKYDLNAGLVLSKSCSSRMFRLISNQKSPITYTILQLRQMWGMEGIYPDTSDFIRRTIEPAKKELDEKAPWSFTYVKNHSESAPENTGRRGKKAITSVTFYPVRKVANLSSSALLSMTSTPLSVLGRDVYNLLLNKFEFTAQGLKNNLLLFETARKVGLDLEALLYDIAPNAIRAVNTPGYTVRAIEQALKERYGVTKTADGYSIPDQQ